MINFRTYTLTFIPAAIALVIVLFSISGTPRGLEPLRSPGELDITRAVTVTNQIVKLGDNRTPGSEANLEAARLIRDEFTELGNGLVAVQDFEGTFNGNNVPMQNVILTLPGRSSDMVVIVAGRDWPSGPGVGASAAASGLLVGLAGQLTNFEHAKTFVLVSTDGLSEGAVGARNLVVWLESQAGQKEVLVISQPGARNPEQPFVVDSSTGRRQTSTGLEQTVAGVVAESTDTDADGNHRIWNSLARLAVPLGLGEQAPLNAAGIGAVAVSSAGEIPLRESGNGIGEEVFGQLGNALLLNILAIDASTQPIERGPSTYLRSGDTVVSGAPIGLLSAALILPAIVALFSVAASSLRGRHEIVRFLLTALAWAVPWVAGLATFYLAALVGLVPRPQFPFDPFFYAIGFGGIVGLILVALAIGGCFWLLKPWRSAAGILSPGLLLVIAGVLAWIGNPFLALLLVPFWHVWILWAVQAPGAQSRVPGIAAAGLAAVCLLPAALAVRTVANTIGAGPWDLLLTVSGGQMGPLLGMASSLIAAGVFGLCLGLDNKPIQILRRLPIRGVNDAP